jgi:hypothetical protein
MVNNTGLKKSGNFNISKSWPGNPGKSLLVVEGHGKFKLSVNLLLY